MKLLDKVAIVIGMTVSLFAASLLFVGHVIIYNQEAIQDAHLTYKLLRQLSSN